MHHYIEYNVCESCFAAHGMGGQEITVLPKLGLVIVHKCIMDEKWKNSRPNMPGKKINDRIINFFSCQ